MTDLIKKDKEIIYVDLKKYIIILCILSGIYLIGMNVLNNQNDFEMIVRGIYITISLVIALLANCELTKSGYKYYKIILISSCINIFENLRIIFFDNFPQISNCMLNYSEILSYGIINCVGIILIYYSFRVISNKHTNLKVVFYVCISMQILCIICNSINSQKTLIRIISIVTIIFFIIHFYNDTYFNIINNNKINYLKITSLLIIFISIILIVYSPINQDIYTYVCLKSIKFIFFINYVACSFCIIKNILLNPYIFMFKDLYEKNESLIWLNKQITDKNIELEKAHKLLKEKETSLKEFLKNIPVPIIMESVYSNRIMFCNKQFANMIELDMKKIINRRLKNIVKIEEQLCNEITNSYLNNIKRCSFINSTGMKYVDIEKIEDVDSSIIVYMFTDVTSKINHDKYVERVKNRKFEEKMKRDFLSSITHDLKTPINVIYSAMQLIGTFLQNKNYEKIKMYNNITRKNCQIINDFIDVIINDQADNEKCFRKDKKVENIVNVIGEITSLFKEYGRSKNVNILFFTNCKNISFKCNRKVIQRIIINLISNSIKYCKKTGEIFVELYDELDGIYLYVIDNGIGMSKQFVKKAFCKYTTANTDASILNNSNGIGLYNVKNMVESQNGSINIRSKIDEGTTFIIKFRRENIDAIRE